MTCTESMPSSKWMNGHAFNAFLLHSSSLKGATFSCFVTTLCCTASSNNQTHKSQDLPWILEPSMSPCTGATRLHRGKPSKPRVQMSNKTAALENSIKTRRAQKILGISPALLQKTSKNNAFFLFQNNTSTFASMPSVPSHGAPQYNWHLLEYLEPNT